MSDICSKCNYNKKHPLTNYKLLCINCKKYIDEQISPNKDCKCIRPNGKPCRTCQNNVHIYCNFNCVSNPNYRVIDSRFEDGDGSTHHGIKRITCPNCKSLECYCKFGHNSSYNPNDKVNHPKHYNSHPSGVECITIIESMPFNIGSAIKYLWRAGLKENAPTIEDYDKAIWYINREKERLLK